MQTVTIHDAKTNLSKYIVAVKNGEEIYIGGFGKPEVKLVLASEVEKSTTSSRSFSRLSEKVVESPDAFSDETDQ